MLVDKTSCWYKPDVSIDNRKKGTQNQEYRDIIQGLVDLIPRTSKTVVDLGCGRGDVASWLFTNRKYTGVDLPNLIEGVSSVINPHLDFIKCDLVEEDADFISDYSIVYMDALIDIMQHPLEVLDKVLDRASKYILLIRQEIVEGKTNVIKNPSYGGFSYHSEIGRDDLNGILKKRMVTVIKEVDAGIGIWKRSKATRHKPRLRYPGEWRSFLLQKKRPRVRKKVAKL